MIFFLDFPLHFNQHAVHWISICYTGFSGREQETPNRVKLSRDWQGHPEDVGPMWQSELQLLLTLFLKARMILRCLLKTKQPSDEVLLCIRYDLSRENNTTHSMVRWRQYKSVLGFSASPPISLRHSSSPETMKSVYFCIQKEKGAWQLTLSACWPCSRAICWGDSATLPSTDRLVGFMLWAAAGKSTVT